MKARVAFVCLALIIALLSASAPSRAAFPNSLILSDPGPVVSDNDAVYLSCNENRTALLGDFVTRSAACDVTTMMVDSFLRMAGCENTASLGYAGCAAYLHDNHKVINMTDALESVRYGCFHSCLLVRCLKNGLALISGPLC
jgi:hypothetical protein